MSAALPPCPCEQNTPDGAPGSVDDTEMVVRFVPTSVWIAWDETGKARLRPAAFPEEELKGSKGKSVSVLRGLTAPDEVFRHAVNPNREPAWAGNPVVAKAQVLILRNITDKRRRCEICVNADPVETELGLCPTHASILRAHPPLDREQRLAWAILRLKMATAFIDVAHASRQPVAQILP
jgi:hypothetical protein